MFSSSGPSGGHNPSISIKLENLDKVNQLMRELPAAIRMKVLRQVVLSGARIFKDEVVRRAPVGRTGRLSDSITVRRGRASETGLREELARVLVARGKGKGGYYSHLVEFGHVIVVRRNRRTIYRGYYPGRPFMRPGFDAKKDEVMRVMLEQTRKKVIRQVNKLRKQKGLDRVPKGYAS